MLIGSKTVEGRLNKGDWAEMKENDLIDWYNEDFGLKREFRTVIISKKIYPSFFL
jgi:ASC-1-like (ASCH) protein